MQTNEVKAYIAKITGFDAQIADDSTDGYPRPKIKATADRHETIAGRLKGVGIKFRTEHDGLMIMASGVCRNGKWSWRFM